MPVEISDKDYYRTSEVCQIVGIGRTTLLRWIKEGIIMETEYRDRRGWRLFSEDEICTLKAEADRTCKADSA
jgi:excisionase family DNA binding protein